MKARAVRVFVTLDDGQELEMKIDDATLSSLKLETEVVSVADYAKLFPPFSKDVPTGRVHLMLKADGRLVS